MFTCRHVAATIRAISTADAIVSTSWTRGHQRVADVTRSPTATAIVTTSATEVAVTALSGPLLRPGQRARRRSGEPEQHGAPEQLHDEREHGRDDVAAQPERGARHHQGRLAAPLARQRPDTEREEGERHAHQRRDQQLPQAETQHEQGRADADADEG